MRHIAVLFVLSCLLAAASAVADSPSQSEHRKRLHPEPLAPSGHWQIGSYDVTLTNENDGDQGPSGTLTVAAGGKSFFTLTDAVLWINPAGFFAPDGNKMSYEERERPYRIGRDVLNLGAPTLVIQGYSLGAHCCMSVTILYLGDRFHAMPTLELLDAESVYFHKVNRHRALAMSTVDFSFHYWRASFVNSAAPNVVLTYNSAVKHYEADPVLMWKPLPSKTKLKNEISAVRRDLEFNKDHQDPETPRELTQPILDLIYSGHITEAYDFLKQTWVGTNDERERYWSEMTTCKLRQSQFWPAVARMNNLAVDKPAANCGG
jgi:hypothetical protein